MNINKKGFTLVELLAVIVILAIILAIAVPAIGNLIANSKKSMFENSSKMILRSMKNDYDGKMASTGSFTDTFILYDNGVRTVYPSSNTLDFTISATDGGIVRHSDGTVTLALYDGTNCLVKTRTSNDVTVTTTVTDKATCLSNIYYKQATAPLANLIPNGDFSNGTTTGWVNSGGNNSLINGKLYHVSSGAYSFSQTYYNMSFINGNKYYVSFSYSNDISITTLLSRWMFNNGAAATTIDTLALTQTNKRYSNVSILNSSTYTNVGINVIQYTPAGSGFYLDDVYVINLTSLYGAGNEPTKEQMDNNLDKVWIDTSTANTPKRFSAGGWVNY